MYGERGSVIITRVAQVICSNFKLKYEIICLCVGILLLSCFNTYFMLVIMKGKWKALSGALLYVQHITFCKQQINILFMLQDNILFFDDYSTSNPEYLSNKGSPYFFPGFTSLFPYYIRIQSSLFWEATTPFALWKWPPKAGGFKSEIAFVINCHKTFWPSCLKTEGGFSSQRPFKTGSTVPVKIIYKYKCKSTHTYICASSVTLTK